MITENTRYRFVKDTAVAGNKKTPFVIKANTVFKTNSRGDYDFLAEAQNVQFDKTVPNYVLSSWLDDGRIEYYGRWKPSHRDEFFYITHGGNVASARYLGDTDFNRPLFKFGNCFETREQAEKVSVLMRELLTGIVFNNDEDD